VRDAARRKPVQEDAPWQTSPRQTEVEPPACFRQRAGRRITAWRQGQAAVISTKPRTPRQKARASEKCASAPASRMPVTTDRHRYAGNHGAKKPMTMALLERKASGFPAAARRIEICKRGDHRCRNWRCGVRAIQRPFLSLARAPV